ncbi:MAG: universal stress protein [Beijerinckiaceae bacterium]|nr:universal stress protein [Beijerinckiaceae bacterium]MCZ8301260.1 universal stress protein [Beijerinckiaceae bacterium]
MFKKILVPVDLNEAAITKSALDAAKGLAASWNADIRLLYVMPIVPASYMEYVSPEFETQEKERVEAELRGLAEGLGLPAGRVSTAVRNGGVYHEVVAEAGESHSDLIVCGSHWPTLATYLVGSFATTIVRHATCSVLVIRQ